MAVLLGSWSSAKGPRRITGQDNSLYLAKILHPYCDGRLSNNPAYVLYVSLHVELWPAVANIVITCMYFQTRGSRGLVHCREVVFLSEVANV